MSGCECLQSATMESEKKRLLKVIKIVKRNGDICNIGFDPTNVENKNSDESLKIRKEANRLFSKKKHDAKTHEELWKLYTKSIALAPNNSEELPAGYANRAVLLLHLKKYKECLLDIDRALKTSESYTLKVKLYCRQNQCHIALQNGKERASLEKANYLLSKIDDATEKNKLKEIIGKLKNIATADELDYVQKEREYEISCENNAVRMSYNEKYGKHLVADRDIHVGERIYVEKFYVTSVNYKKFYAYCSHCLAISWATIPCEKCSYYMYCTEKCREEAWQKYHDFECFVKFEKYYQLENLANCHIQLALRALIMGFKETGSIANLQTLTNEIDKCTDLGKRGLNKDGKFSIDSFRSIYSLNYAKTATKDEIYACQALDIVVLLARKTDILGKDFKYTNNMDLVNNENVIFLASLLLRLFSICFVNAFRLVSGLGKCESSKTGDDCWLNSCCCRGMSLSLFTSLFNHSCDNNVEKIYTNDGRVAYYAVQPIQKNAQIFSSYYVNFMTSLKSARDALLSNVFEFTCDCEACKNDWPILLEQPRSFTSTESEIYAKHSKTFDKLDEKKNHRYGTKTIRTFMRDTEVLLKSENGPTFLQVEFRYYLFVLIVRRYFKELKVSAECENNLNK